MGDLGLEMGHVAFVLTGSIGRLSVPPRYVWLGTVSCCSVNCAQPFRLPILQSLHYNADWLGQNDSFTTVTRSSISTGPYKFSSATMCCAGYRGKVRRRLSFVCQCDSDLLLLTQP